MSSSNLSEVSFENSTQKFLFETTSPSVSVVLVRSVFLVGLVSILLPSSPYTGL